MGGKAARSDAGYEGYVGYEGYEGYEGYVGDDDTEKGQPR